MSSDDCASSRRRIDAAEDDVVARLQAGVARRDEDAHLAESLLQREERLLARRVRPGGERERGDDDRVAVRRRPEDQLLRRLALRGLRRGRRRWLRERLERRERDDRASRRPSSGRASPRSPLLRRRWRRRGPRPRARPRPRPLARAVPGGCGSRTRGSTPGRDPLERRSSGRPASAGPGPLALGELRHLRLRLGRGLSRLLGVDLRGRLGLPHRARVCAHPAARAEDRLRRKGAAAGGALP